MAFVDNTADVFRREMAFRDERQRARDLKDKAMQDFATSLASIPQAYYKIQEDKAEKLKKEQKEQKEMELQERKIGIQESYYDASKASKEAAAAKAIKDDTDKKRKELDESISSLRKEVFGLPVTKEAQTVVAAYEKIKDAAKRKDAPGDQAMIFGFMKTLDPGSTVREGEFATVENSRGIPDTIRNMYNKAMQGTRLTDQQRQEITNTAYGQTQAQINNFISQTAQQREYARSRGLPEGQIFPTMQVQPFQMQAQQLAGQKAPSFLQQPTQRPGAGNVGVIQPAMASDRPVAPPKLDSAAKKLKYLESMGYK